MGIRWDCGIVMQQWDTMGISLVNMINGNYMK
jgi:hypothetical protein